MHIRHRGYGPSDFGISSAMATVGRVESALAHLEAWELEVLELRYRWQYPVWLCIRELRRSWAENGGPVGRRGSQVQGGMLFDRRRNSLSRTRYYSLLGAVLDRVAALMWAEG